MHIKKIWMIFLILGWVVLASCQVPEDDTSAPFDGRFPPAPGPNTPHSSQKERSPLEWNLVTFSLENQQTLESFFSEQETTIGLHSIWSWNKIQENWEVYPKTGEFPVLNSISIADAYWFRSAQPWSPTSSGNYAEYQFLGNGWNLLGLSPSESKSLSPREFIKSTAYETLNCEDVHPIESIWAWREENWKIYFPNPGQLSVFNQMHNTNFSPLESIVPGEGLWINTSKPTGLWRNDRQLDIPEPQNCNDSLAGNEGRGDEIYPNAGNGGIDVLSYEIALTVAPYAHSVEGTVKMRVKTTRPLSSFNLDLVDLSVNSISLDGIAANYTHSGQELSVFPAVSLSKEADFELIIHYSGAPKSRADQGQYVGWRNYGTSDSFVISQVVGAPTWFPSNDVVTDKATYTFLISVPRTHTVAANGQLRTVETVGETTTYSWEASDPMTSYLATVNIFSNLTLIETTYGSLPIRHYLPANSSNTEKGYFESVPQMLEFFSTSFGSYPFESFGSVVLPYSTNLALETQTLPVYGRSIVQRYGEAVIAHELAHQWFGNSVSVKQWRHDLWINEGLATFSEWLWSEHKLGSQSYQQQVSSVYNRALSYTTPPGMPQVTDLFNYTVYGRGGLVFAALRHKMGDVAFFNFLRTYTSRYKNGNAGTTELIALLHEMTGENYYAVIYPWLYNGSLPGKEMLGIEQLQFSSKEKQLPEIHHRY